MGEQAKLAAAGGEFDYPVLKGSVGPDVIDIRKLYGQTGMFTYDPGFTSTASCESALTYIDAEFREGPDAGKEVPLVSAWTGSVGLSWEIWQKWLVLDATMRYIGQRRLDNDQANVQPMIGDHTVFDVKLGGENEQVYWSFAVQNIFDEEYFDYGVASTTTIGRYNAYPLPGRTFLGRVGLKF